MRNYDYIEFELYGDPAPKGSVSAFPVIKRDAFPIYNIKELFKKLHINISHGAKSKKWEAAVAEKVKDFEPLQGALGVSLNFGLKKGKTVKRKWPTTKPDIDKLERAVLDGLKHVLGDDSHVCSLMSHKVYSPNPSVKVKIWELEKRVED
jgi:Holliday junction resolvase RusA-like endonuclease